MGKHPILHYINEIKNKLGFGRTMTASGADVVDAVNGLSGQITNRFKTIELNTDLNTVKESGMYYCKGVINSPNGNANAWGSLIVVSGNDETKQIWSQNDKNSLFLRNFKNDAWSEWVDQIGDLGPYNGLDSTSTTAALSAAQGKILNNMLFSATNESYASSTFTDTWLLTAKNGAYKVSGGNIIGTIIEGAISSYGLILVFTSVPYNADSGIEEYGVIFYADANNNLYYRNFYRKKSQNIITWRGALQKITAS